MKRRLTLALVLCSACLLLMGVFAQAAFALPAWWANKVMESGGNGPAPNPSPDPNYTANGTDCYTTAYSSMVGAQGKVNSCYVDRITSSLGMYYAESGWLWMGTESGAPIHFFATVSNSGPQYLWYIAFFPGGETHRYGVAHVGSGNWGCWIDNNYQGQHNVGIQYGWSTVGGERYNCGGNAEFTGLRKYKNGAWSSWTLNRDWDWYTYQCDNDPSYEYKPQSSTVGWIRPN